MKIINEQTELVDVRSLKPHPKNINRGNTDLIAESIHESGFYGQIIAQRSTGHILVGHHRLQAAQQLGAKEVPVTWVEVDDTRALKIMLADNSTAAAAHRDEEALAALLSELKLTDDLTGTGYGEDDLNSLIASIADNAPTPEPVEAPEPQVDRAEELRAKWQTERGQLWLIPSKTVTGKSHRLLCGDSTNAEDVGRLMDGQKADALVTDPPYGMNLNADYSQMGSATIKPGRKHQNIEGDDHAFDAGHLFRDFGESQDIFLFGADYFAETIPNRTSGAWLVWDKRVEERYDSIIGSAFELVWSKRKIKREILRHEYVSWANRMADNVGGEKLHPTMKPTQLMAMLLKKITGPLVADPYLGSGSTLIASEQTSHVCYGMELEPKYIAVILERLSGMGLTPELQ